MGLYSRETPGSVRGGANNDHFLGNRQEIVNERRDGMKLKAIAVMIGAVLMTLGGVQAEVVDWVYTWEPDEPMMEPNLGYHGNPRDNWFDPFVDARLIHEGVEGTFNSGWGELGEPGPSGAGVEVNVDYVRDFGVELDAPLTLGGLTTYAARTGFFGNTITWDSGVEGIAATLDMDYNWGMETEAAWQLNSDLHFKYNARNDRSGDLRNVISGQGSLILEPNNTQLDRPLRMIGDPNTYSGGTEIIGQEAGTTTAQLRVEKSGAFGSGDVELTGTAHVMMESDDVMAAGAALYVGADAIWELTDSFSQFEAISVMYDGQWLAAGQYYSGDIPWLTGDGDGFINVIGEPVEGIAFPKDAGFVRATLESDDWQLVGLPFNQVADEMVALADVLGTIGFANGTEVMAWDGTGYAASSFFLGTWSGNIELRRGQGFWIKSPVDTDLYLLGQMPDEADTAIELPRGLQLISSPYPAAIDLNDEDILLSVPFNGDQIFFLGEEAGYTSNAYFMGTWSGAGMLEPGKGYWYDSVDEQDMLIGRPY